MIKQVNEPSALPRDEARLAELAAEIEGAGAHVCDVADLDALVVSGRAAAGWRELVGRQQTIGSNHETL
ncbi:MAG: hypothetical protein QF578_22530 [Alphaproteobacteria bacterium]|jgi:hypothetical protein|nr:hypothetical protein [Alphaproteobacteria bacterium]MDP6816109.1 hypothetical protein [Alphaproteobacteria bacterium]